MDRKPTKKSLSEISLEEAHGGSGRRQLIFSSSEPFVSKNFQAMTKGFLPPGASYDWHKHDEVDELFLVVSGIGIIKYEDGSEFPYKDGDLFYSPAGIAHILTNTGKDDNVFYFIRISE
jgi:mannose-6-phosphate isomerase-like protein (cupin superfamily)